MPDSALHQGHRGLVTSVHPSFPQQQKARQSTLLFLIILLTRGIKAVSNELLFLTYLRHCQANKNPSKLPRTNKQNEIWYGPSSKLKPWNQPCLHTVSQHLCPACAAWAPRPVQLCPLLSANTQGLKMTLNVCTSSWQHSPVLGMVHLLSTSLRRHTGSACTCISNSPPPCRHNHTHSFTPNSLSPMLRCLHSTVYPPPVLVPCCPFLP